MTITVEDLKGFVVNDPHVRCGCGIQPSKTEGVAVFEIHPDDVPETRQLTFFADDGKNSGKKAISFGRTRSISETITLTEQTQAKSPDPPHVPPAKVTSVEAGKPRLEPLDPQLQKLRKLHQVSLIRPEESGYPLKAMRNNTYGGLNGSAKHSS